MVRVDKWLWAARFFKTRGKAKEAIDGGKVHVNGQRTKPSKDLAINDELRIRQRWDELIIVVTGLSEQRRGAPEAQKLYTETEASIASREMQALQRKAAGQHITSKERPTKKQRRQIHKFLDQPE